MAGQIQDYVLKQSGAGKNTMFPAYPKESGNPYIALGAGVFDVIVTWSSQAAIHLAWQPAGFGSVVKTYRELIKPAQWNETQRRGMIRLGSESAGQSFYLQADGPLDAAGRATVQIIPASVTFDFKVTTS